MALVGLIIGSFPTLWCMHLDGLLRRLPGYYSLNIPSHPSS